MKKGGALLLTGGLAAALGLLLLTLIAFWGAHRGLISQRFECLPTEPVTPYIVTDLKGHSSTAAHLFGQPTILFFGFTYCPELCPTTLADVTRWLEKLGPLADHLKILFVTVDPARDTPEVLKSYLASFDRRIEGLILSPDNLALMTKAYHVTYEKTDLGHGDYTVDHEGSIFLLDANGHVLDTVNYTENDDLVLPKLKKLAEGGWRKEETLTNSSGCIGNP